MKKVVFKKDIHFMYVSAHSFPEDIFKAHQELHSRMGKREGCNYFGISFSDGIGKTQYKGAATERFEGEGASLNLKTASLKKGTYPCITFPDGEENSTESGKAFKILIINPENDLNVEQIKSVHDFI